LKIVHSIANPEGQKEKSLGIYFAEFCIDFVNRVYVPTI